LRKYFLCKLLPISGGSVQHCRLLDVGHFDAVISIDDTLVAGESKPLGGNMCSKGSDFLKFYTVRYSDYVRVF
jgi:hypothetical protein